MSVSANVTQWLGWALMILTGSMNRPGGVWFHPGFGHQLEAFELPVSPLDGLFGPGPRSRPEAQSFFREWPCAVLGDEIRAGNIRAVLNLGGHLVTAFPDANDLVPALRSLDVFATIEIIGNDTTALSTHVLPTKDQLERADVTLWDALLPRVAAQHTPAVVDPVGDRRSTWWVLAELGRRLGFELADTAGQDATDDARLAKLTTRSRCTFDELVTNGWVETPYDLPAQWVENHLDRLGGWRLAPPVLVDQLAALEASGREQRRSPMEPAPGSEAPSSVEGREAGIPRAASRSPRAGSEAAESGNLEAPASLVLVPRRQVRHLNSQLDFLGEVVEVIVHPDDATAAGVADGQPVVVRSAQGELAGIAKVDPSVRAGTVSVPHGHQGANVNLLTSKDRIDPTTGMARYSGVPVSLHRRRPRTR